MTKLKIRFTEIAANLKSILAVGFFVFFGLLTLLLHLIFLAFLMVGIGLKLLLSRLLRRSNDEFLHHAHDKQLSIKANETRLRLSQI